MNSSQVTKKGKRIPIKMYGQLLNFYLQKPIQQTKLLPNIPHIPGPHLNKLMATKKRIG